MLSRENNVVASPDAFVLMASVSAQSLMTRVVEVRTWLFHQNGCLKDSRGKHVSPITTSSHLS